MTLSTTERARRLIICNRDGYQVAIVSAEVAVRYINVGFAIMVYEDRVVYLYDDGSRQGSYIELPVARTIGSSFFGQEGWPIKRFINLRSLHGSRGSRLGRGCIDHSGHHGLGFREDLSPCAGTLFPLSNEPLLIL